MKALVLTAHPDDEILFLGAHILSNPDWEWRVICMTHETDDWRGREFSRSQEALDARGVSSRFAQLGMADEDVPEGNFVAWEDALAQHLDAFPADEDVVYTHNRAGEYGHPHHIACNVIARRIFEQPVHEFFYPPLVPGAVTLWRSDSVSFAHDPRKHDVFMEAYGGHWSALRAHQPYLMKFLIEASCDLVTR